MPFSSPVCTTGSALFLLLHVAAMPATLPALPTVEAVRTLVLLIILLAWRVATLTLRCARHLISRHFGLLPPLAVLAALLPRCLPPTIYACCACARFLRARA